MTLREEMKRLNQPGLKVSSRGDTWVVEVSELGRSVARGLRWAECLSDKVDVKFVGDAERVTQERAVRLEHVAVLMFEAGADEIVVDGFHVVKCEKTGDLTCAREGYPDVVTWPLCDSRLGFYIMAQGMIYLREGEESKLRVRAEMSL